MTNVIWSALDRPGDDRPHLQCWEGTGYHPYTWDDWRRGAFRAAAGLQARGVEPGMRVAGVLTNTFGVCSAVLGSWMAGATLLSLPTMRRGITVEEYVEQLKGLCRSTGAHVLLLEDRFSAFLDTDAVGVPIVSFDTLGIDAKPDLALLDDHEPAFVQYSSGSTNEPKGVVLSMGAVGKQEEMLADRLRVEGGDSQGVMWLPLSHDMGLFGCVLLSWAAGMRLAVSTPERFLRRPQTWFDDAHDVQANITAAPNFGLALATRKAKTTPPKGSCPMRTVVLGGERIELPTLDAAHEVLAPFGITRESITPAYGLAEGTLAVTMKPYGEIPGTVWIDREAAYSGEVSVTVEQAKGATAVVSCGPPVRGVEVSTDAESLGRIRVASESLADGYINNPEATAASFSGGTFQTEDLGFLHDGELFVLGRTDDVIVIAGRNVPARDIERDMELHEGVRPGCCVLIDGRHEGQSKVVALVEPSNGGADYGRVADELANTVYKTGGLRLAECVFVRAGHLPKTPSGKIQRFRCRALLNGDSGDRVLERVAM